MTSVAKRYGTAGSDTFVFSYDTDTIDVVYAGGGRDVISDGRSDGLWSSDVYRGQGGADTLISHNGNDQLFGGWGADYFTVSASWFDPALVPFSIWEHATVGFDVTVVGGRGDDTLVISNSAGATTEVLGDEMIIHTRFGGTIAVHGVEHLLMI